ncbi:uncharacterized protein EV154DRAFT_330345 [Mucor mucedo]|uniref:uncharacterized protein n=1 Tax=Mucor mucedo TaxID=29922 RepID=UPI00222102E1|nr:uncharacterized protein EV154DRAFT_330345 [Mucor mucedo]KAI7887752.1 hypothetical protein EV154DRAFT_330345 [Mucor mucedo]
MYIKQPQHQKISEERANVHETRHNERENISLTSSTHNRVIIIIDDMPPGSPIPENTQAEEGKNNTSNYKNPDKASRIVTVSIGDSATNQSGNDNKYIIPRQSISPVARQIGTHGFNTSPPRNQDRDTSLIYRAENRDRCPCRYRRQSPSTHTL